MIQIDHTIVSIDIINEHFACNLSACKGACCVEGDSGAPLETEEVKILESIYPEIKPFLRKEGVEAIENQGKYVVDNDGEYVTPLVQGKECAYVVFDQNGVSKCGIELAYENRKISFKKPISCHLYPIRITKYKNFDAVNYHEWHVCSAAKSCGKSKKIRLFEFLKDALIRKYGEEWYRKLEFVNRAQI